MRARPDSTLPRCSLLNPPPRGVDLSENESASDGEANPNLHVPGKPHAGLVKKPDGRRSLYPLPRTKWDNCMSLTRELEGRALTDDDLARWQLTRHEYEHFLTLYTHSAHANGRALPLT
jgi:hypothetical protein